MKGVVVRIEGVCGEKVQISGENVKNGGEKKTIHVCCPASRAFFTANERVSPAYIRVT